MSASSSSSSSRLEHALLAPNIRRLVKATRNSQKLVVKHLGAAVSLSKQQPPPLDDVIQRVARLQQTLTERHHATKQVFASLRQRIAHAGHLEAADASTPMRPRQCRVGSACRHPPTSDAEEVAPNNLPICAPCAHRERTRRLDRLAVNHLLTTGYARTAAALAAASQTTELVDAEVWGRVQEVMRSLRDEKQCDTALAWCGENRSTLQRGQSPLEFELRLQQFVELARAKQTANAIAHAQQYLAPLAIQPDQLFALQEVMAALAFVDFGTLIDFDEDMLAAGDDDDDDDDDRAATRRILRGKRHRIGGTASNAAGGAPKRARGAAAAASASLGAAVAASAALAASASELPLPLRGPRSQRQDSVSKAADATASAATTAAERIAESAPAAPQAWHKYRRYFLSSRWERLARIFAGAAGQVYGLAARSPLDLHLQFGLGVLKTPECGDHAGDSEAMPPPSAADCPACTSLVAPLVARVVSLPRQNSCLFCRITGRPMTNPIVLPNGQVYSDQALAYMASHRPDKTVQCPVTHRTYALSDCKTAYLV